MFRPRGLVVAIAAPVSNADWDLPAFARVTDKVFLMAYDEHETSGDAGPIASQRWFARVVADAGGVYARAVLVSAGPGNGIRKARGHRDINNAVAISGAQPTDMFLAALKQVATPAPGQTCSVGGTC